MSVVRRLCLAAGLVCLASTAFAQSETTWPERPIRILVNFAPGGGTDNAVRPYTEPLHRALGQPFVLEHKGGAAGAIGIEAAIKMQPNGYNFIATPSPSVVVVPHLRKVGYDPLKDMVPVAAFSWYPMMLSIHPSVPVANLKEMVAYAKANPDRLSLASSGIGSTGHLIAEALNRSAGISILHVPYRGSAEALQDMLAGVVHMFADPTVATHVRAGKVRLLAVTGGRHPEYPDVPTFAETYPDADFIPWNALFAPVGTPEPIIRKLAKAINTIAASPEMAAMLPKVGQYPMVTTPEQLGQVLRKDYDRFGVLIRERNIKSE